MACIVDKGTFILLSSTYEQSYFNIEDKETQEKAKHPQKLKEATL